MHETARSIFAQTYPYWEWIIVDDGSTDNSLEILQQFATEDKRVKVLQRQREPKGACTCRNIAVENSTGDYLIFLDTDDLLASFCLEQRVNAATANAGSAFSIFPMLLFHHKADDTRRLWNIDNGQDDTLRVLYGDPVCQGTGTIWKKHAFQALGMWDEQLALWQDIDLHLRAMLNLLPYSKCMDLSPDVFIRISELSLSRTGFHSPAKLKSRIAVLNKALRIAIENNLLDRYRKGFCFMARDIFIGAANSNAFKEGRHIQQLMEKNELVASHDKKWLSVYLFFRKLKLYKFSFWERNLLKKMARLAPSVKPLLGQTAYDKIIVM